LQAVAEKTANKFRGLLFMSHLVNAQTSETSHVFFVLFLYFVKIGRQRTHFRQICIGEQHRATYL